MQKKSWYLIIAVLIVIAIVVTVVASRLLARANLDALESVNSSGANSDLQTQTYLASNSPTFRNGDKIFGSAEAALKIFVYEDYTSVYSANLADTLDKIKAEMGDQAAIIVRPYVVNNLEAAQQLAQAVDCAGEQGKWKEMRALLFAQAKNKQLLVDNLANYENQLSLNTSDFTACLTNQTKSGKIEQSVVEAQGYGVQGAPTMFIGDEMIIGARPYEDFVDSNGDKISGLKSVVAGKIN